MSHTEPEENRCTCCPVHGQPYGQRHWPVYVPVPVWPAPPGYGSGWWWSPVPPSPWYHPVTYATIGPNTTAAGTVTFTTTSTDWAA